MRIPLPDWDMAKMLAESYNEDGVAATHGYDETTGQWFADLDDGDYDRYQSWLRSERSEVLKSFSEDWGGVNIQGLGLGPPLPHQTRLSLYLVDVGCGVTKGFKVTNTLRDLLERKTEHISIGSTCSSCGRKTKVVLRWEGRPPDKRGREGK